MASNLITFHIVTLPDGKEFVRKPIPMEDARYVQQILPTLLF